MKVTFELSPKDLSYFRRTLKEAREKARGKSEAAITKGAEDLLSDLQGAEISDFVKERLATLETMLELLEDDEWKLSGEDRARIVEALAYFAEPDDLIPDRVPGLGYLDDAIMIELVAEDLKHDLDAYHDFCAYRAAEEKRRGKKEDPATRDEWLHARRQQLHQRMRRRRRSRDRRGGSSSGRRSGLSLW